MILNPVMQGGSEEKVYRITDESGLGFPKSAKAGEFLFAYGIIGTKLRIIADDSQSDFPNLPYSAGDYPIPQSTSPRAPQSTYFIVMPASNITIHRIM